MSSDMINLPATTGPAQLSGTPNPGEPANDPLDPPIATESDIWTFNPLTLELTASWTNPDGSRSPVTIFFDQDPDFGNVGITGDLADVISASQASLAQSRAPPVGPSAVPIRLFYVNIDPEVCASIIA
ncbi:hypothetical protein SISSUDRAFT_1051980 [Sistotremastrum suecicum HHB10207 ss-3]|uniref:Uncharacterized protein n=1 Tax=Sistotremastrum suecicum HHB10207 ss-3 TaxID=1314776 RepID=A0A166A7C4_9AGAM|nr:hypothetical protein SISSUDRAFT_1051980 [Sistotremastrum suecicum HHB10207 ss-3]